jgi:putative exporter of polyketide antibiotics
MTKKTKKDLRRERNEREEAEREAALQRVQMYQRVFRICVIALPIVTIAAALGAFYGAGDRRMAAMIGLVGTALWIPALLGLIGASVKPRDRIRAGSINFGKRR